MRRVFPCSHRIHVTPRCHPHELIAPAAAPPVLPTLPLLLLLPRSLHLPRHLLLLLPYLGNIVWNSCLKTLTIFTGGLQVQRSLKRLHHLKVDWNDSVNISTYKTFFKWFFKHFILALRQQTYPSTFLLQTHKRAELISDIFLCILCWKLKRNSCFLPAIYTISNQNVALCHCPSESHLWNGFYSRSTPSTPTEASSLRCCHHRPSSYQPSDERWKVWRRRLLDGSRCCSKTCSYLSAVMEPFQMCGFPVPEALMPRF